MSDNDNDDAINNENERVNENENGTKNVSNCNDINNDGIGVLGIGEKLNMRPSYSMISLITNDSNTMSLVHSFDNCVNNARTDNNDNVHEKDNNDNNANDSNSDQEAINNFNELNRSTIAANRLVSCIARKEFDDKNSLDSFDSDADMSSERTPFTPDYKNDGNEKGRTGSGSTSTGYASLSTDDMQRDDLLDDDVIANDALTNEVIATDVITNHVDKDDESLPTPS